MQVGRCPYTDRADTRVHYTPFLSHTLMLLSSITDLTVKLSSNHRTSDAYTRAVYDLVMDQLVKKHAEIRLSAFQIINELFMRSHTFRELLISDFKKFTHLVTGSDHHHPLPPPKPAAGEW